jgi:hypothetical protein
VGSIAEARPRAVENDEIVAPPPAISSLTTVAVVNGELVAPPAAISSFATRRRFTRGARGRGADERRIRAANAADFIVEDTIWPQRRIGTPEAREFIVATPRARAPAARRARQGPPLNAAVDVRPRRRAPPRTPPARAGRPARRSSSARRPARTLGPFHQCRSRRSRRNAARPRDRRTPERPRPRPRPPAAES